MDEEADILRFRLLLVRSELGAAYAWMREAVAVLPHAEESARNIDVQALIDRCPLPPEERP
jgi:hypothetical protein